MKNKNGFSKQLAKIMLLLLCLLGKYSVQAQNDLMAEAAKMQLAYKNPAYLSLDVKYTYAADSLPSVILDSSFGTFKISGLFYWGQIDSTEYMQNSSYSVMLYKPDRLMRIANPTTMYPSIANFSAFDSLVGKNNYTTTYSYSGVNKTIILTFTNAYDFAYKSFRITYDTTTHFVKQIKYIIRDDFSDYNDSYNRPANGNSSPYIIITADYTNYQTVPFSTTIFNSGNYFLLSGNTYVPQPPYGDYEVFIASPNLIK